MWTKQRQRHDFDDSVDCQPSKTKTPYQYDNSWEEQAFAEDAAGRLGGCVWPPRSYSCSFCRREFRSAQALGGHMNVHRRDRARLKQSPNPQIPFTSLGFQCSSQELLTSVAFDVPNPITYPSYSGFRTFLSCTSPATDELNLQPTDVISYSQSDPKTEKDERNIISDPRVRDKDHVRTGFSDEGLNLSFRQPRPTSAMSDGWEEAATGCKRRKTDDETSTQFYVKSSSLVARHHHHHHHHHHIQSEVIGLSSSSLHDLDLELRLGGLSKVE